MIILDTNVVSDPLSPKPDHSCLAWLNSQDLADLYLTSTTLFEIEFGMHLLKEGNRKQKLAEEIRIHRDQLFAGRILSFDAESAGICARIFASLIALGRQPKLADCQIASIAMRHGFALATRNTKDFQHEGLRVINPWTD
jgi:toxin FitB